MRQILQLIQGRVERLSVSFVTPLLDLNEHTPEGVEALTALSAALLNTLFKLLEDHSQTSLFERLIEQLCELYERLHLPLGVCAVVRLLTTLERHLLASLTEDNVTISALIEWRRATLSLTERVLSEVALIEAARPALTSSATEQLSAWLLSERERLTLHAPLLDELKRRLDERSALSARHLYWVETCDPLWWRLSLGEPLERSQLTTLSIGAERGSPTLPWQLTRTLARSLSELLSELLERSPHHERVVELVSVCERLRLWAEPLDLDQRGSTARAYLEQLTPLSRRVWLTRAFQRALTALSEPSAASEGLLLWLELNDDVALEEREWLWELLSPLRREETSLTHMTHHRAQALSSGSLQPLIVVVCAHPELKLSDELTKQAQLSHSPLPQLELCERLPQLFTGLSSLDLTRLEGALKGRDLACAWLTLWALAARGELTLTSDLKSDAPSSRWALTLSHESLKSLHTARPERALLRGLLYALPSDQRGAHLKSLTQRSAVYDTRLALSLTASSRDAQHEPQASPASPLTLKGVHLEELTFEHVSLLSLTAQRPSLLEALERACDEVSVWWGLSAHVRERRRADRRAAQAEEAHQDRAHQDRAHQDRAHQDRAHQDRAHQDRERREKERRAHTATLQERPALERGERAWRERHFERAEVELASALGASARGSAPWSRARVSFALLCLERGELDEAELFLREALESPADEGEGSCWARVRALTLLGLTLNASERDVKRREGARQLREAWRLCLDLGELSLTPLLSASLAMSALKVGVISEALEALGEAKRAASALRWRSLERLLSGALASCWLELGALAQARGALQEALNGSSASPLSKAQELREQLSLGAMELALGSPSEVIFRLKELTEQLSLEPRALTSQATPSQHEPSALKLAHQSRLEASLLFAVALTAHAESISDPRLRLELIEEGFKRAKFTRLHTHATPAHELSARAVEARLRALKLSCFEGACFEGAEQLKARGALEGVRSEVRARWAGPFERGALSLTCALRYALVGAEASASHMELLTELELLKPYLLRVSAKGVSLNTLSERWELQRLAQLAQQPLSELL